MRVLCIVHQADAGPGVFAEAMDELGWKATGAVADADAVIVFGGSAHPDQNLSELASERALLAGCLQRGVPALGVCLGAQLLAQAAGGAARRASRPEIGWHRVAVSGAGASDPVLGALAPEFEAFGWHSYECVLPPDAVALATSEVCVQAYRVGRCAWGIQFHAEVSRADALGWIGDYAADPDAVRAGVDPDALRAATEPRIRAWNDLGRALCRRFLAAAAKR